MGREATGIGLVAGTGKGGPERASEAVPRAERDPRGGSVHAF